jgi:hypothetical protein
MTTESTTPNARPHVLVIHALRPTSRQTTIDHLLSFREHLPHADVQYLHFQQPLPKEFEDIEVDLLVINYDYLNYRFTPLWPFVKNRHINIARKAKKVVAIAQDDFWANKLLDNWCIEWRVDRILTASEDGWDLLYPRSHQQIEICGSLTGYAKSKIAPRTEPLVQRRIDLGQRVREMPAHLGRVGQLKSAQSVAFASLATKDGFNVDVSTKIEDSFIGAAWFDFLKSCRFTIGMKGGASLVDPYGLIHTKVEAFTKRSPNSSYSEIEHACFRGKSQAIDFVAVSPRLFESASAGTCQILPPSDYLGVLNPWEHYLPLNEDLSNSSKVFSAMRDLEMCQGIADRAKSVLIESGLFDYSRLVETVTDGLLSAVNVDNTLWNQLSAYLDDSRRLQLISIELHDAVQNLILAKVVDVDLSMSAVISSEFVQNRITEYDLEDWLARQTEFASRDSCYRRSVWTWRDPRISSEV